MKRLLLSAALLVVACDPSDPELYVPTYDPEAREPIASTEFCALLARNTCAVLRPCCEALPFSWDEAKCRLSSRTLCEARRSRAMELGLIYDDLQGGRCVRGTAILLPKCRTPTDDPLAADVREACQQVFHGGARVGGPCAGTGVLECTPPDLGVRVACEGGTCVPKPLLSPGARCTGFGSSCPAGLACFGEPLRCQAVFHPLGAPCSPTGSPEADRCDASIDRFCDPVTDQCAVLPDVDESCTVERGCRKPYRCDLDRTGTRRCTDAKPLGAACNDDKDCGTKLCSGQPGSLARICVPGGLGPPIAPTGLAKGDPVEYISRLAAMCSGVIPEGAGSLSPFVLPAATK